MLTALAVAASTLVSEDLACIAAGLLVQRGELSAAVATISCGLGIFVGDLGLWVLGRVAGVGLLKWPWAARRLGGGVMGSLGSRLRDHLGIAILASRFTPGARLPLYLASGVLGVPGVPFAAWSLVAIGLWTPPLVLGAAALGEAASKSPSRLLGGGALSGLVVIAAAWLLLRVARSLPRSAAGRRISAWLGR